MSNLSCLALHMTQRRHSHRDTSWPDKSRVISADSGSTAVQLEGSTWIRGRTAASHTTLRPQTCWWSCASANSARINSS